MKKIASVLLEAITSDIAKLLQERLEKYYRKRSIDVSCKKECAPALRGLLVRSLGGTLKKNDLDSDDMLFAEWTPPKRSKLYCLGQEGVHIYYMLAKKDGNEFFFSIKNGGEVGTKNYVPYPIIAQWRTALGFIENQKFKGFLMSK